MRVVLWSESFWPNIGGVEVFNARLLLAMRGRGHECIVVTRHDSPDLPSEDQHEGVPVYRFPLWSALMSRDIDQLVTVRRQVADLKRAFAPDLIHIHGFGPTCSLFHLETTKAYPTSLLVTLANDERPEFAVKRELMVRLLRSANWVNGVSTETLRQARQMVPEITPRSSVIYYGLDVPPLLPTPLLFAAPRLLCLGRLVPQKGLDLALSALASLIDRFPGAQMVIAGDGPEQSKLKQQITELGLTGRVERVGWVAPDQVPALINTATMVVMPSRWEGLPLVALQASVMARPIVATRVGGLPEVVVHQKTGLVVEPEDCAGLAEAVAFLLEHPEVAVQMGQAGRRRVQEVFGWQRCIDDYDALYKKLSSTVTQ
jgi:glycogen synthase